MSTKPPTEFSGFYFCVPGILPLRRCKSSAGRGERNRKARQSHAILISAVPVLRKSSNVGMSVIMDITRAFVCSRF
jgi:hypothetical protein